LSCAVFLDRDGVIIDDVGLLSSVGQLRLIDGSALAIQRFKQKGFRVIVVTNQTVIARGLQTNIDVDRIHYHLQEILFQEVGEMVDAFYVCPHHPNANLVEYRVVCECRKPKPGLILQAASDWQIDRSRSWLIGDRLSDVMAGNLAGCRTILVKSGRHLDHPIESNIEFVSAIPDHVCKDLLEAEKYIYGDAVD
jgi:D-glycero-D-manno-heptose 1,7-bisphosphate phosphatase